MCPKNITTKDAATISPDHTDLLPNLCSISTHRLTHLIGHEELGGGGKRIDAGSSGRGLVDLADGGSKGHGRGSGGKGRDGGGKDGGGELHCYTLCIDGQYL